MKIMITGGAGFIGHHLVEHLLKTTDHTMVVVDKATNVDRLREVCADRPDHKRVQYLWRDVRSMGRDLRNSGRLSDDETEALLPVDHVWHLAAESHVDTSIADPVRVIRNNVMATVGILEWIRAHPVEKFLYFSTDEVFGPAHSLDYGFVEWARYKSGNPYAASKAAGEEICLAYANTYQLPILITHCMNVFGERQDVEKFIPGTMRKVLRGEDVIIHADPTCTTPGSRFYIHARNVASAVLTVMEKGQLSEKYNIVGEREVDNLTLAQMIADCMGKSLRYQLVDFHSARPGHDLRYALSGRRLTTMGWTPPKTFEEGLRKTVEWTLTHPEWLDTRPTDD